MKIFDKLFSREPAGHIDVRSIADDEVASSLQSLESAVDQFKSGALKYSDFLEQVEPFCSAKEVQVLRKDEKISTDFSKAWRGVVARGVENGPMKVLEGRLEKLIGVETAEKKPRGAKYGYWIFWKKNKWNV